MNWLFPGFLAGAALVGLPVLLHVLRKKPRQIIRFPSLYFLGRTALRDSRRHRLLRWITLMLRCAAIVLLAAAFARPFHGQLVSANGRALVIALDNSMSMQARGRWEKAVQQARDQLNSLGAGDHAALLFMHPEPTWLVPMTGDLSRVRRVLESAQPGFEKTRYSKPLRVAGETLSTTPAGTKTLVWAADEQNIGWRGVDLSQTLPAGVNVIFHEVAPTPARQAAIVSLRRSREAEGGLDITVRQFHETVDQRRLIVRAADRVLADRVVSLLKGDNPIHVPLNWPVDAAGLRVSLDADDLVADDSAWIACGSSSSNTVLLDVAVETDFLSHAIRATDKLDEARLQTASLPEGEWPRDSVVVLRSEASFRGDSLARLNRFLKSGGALCMFVNGGAAQTQWLKEHGVDATARPIEDEPWHLRGWDSEHPTLIAFRGQSLLPLLEIKFYRGHNLAGDSLVPLANWPDGSMAIAEWSGADRTVLLLGFEPDRDSTDWPIRPSFVPFLHRSIEWIGTASPVESAYQVGDVIELPEGDGRWRAIDTLTAQPDKIVNGTVRPQVPGLYEFSANGARRVIAVNCPAEESDLAPWPNPERLTALESKEVPKAIAASDVAMNRETTESQKPMWWWLIAVSALALLAELAVANRTAL